MKFYIFNMHLLMYQVPVTGPLMDAYHLFSSKVLSLFVCFGSSTFFRAIVSLFKFMDQNTWLIFQDFDGGGPRKDEQGPKDHEAPHRLIDDQFRLTIDDP